MLTAPRYVPRSVFVGERTWVIEMVDTQFGYLVLLPRPLHEPCGTPREKLAISQSL